ncbi:hypothetical protein REPUB_Repub01dG0233700 [Reevesia pubescens]
MRTVALAAMSGYRLHRSGFVWFRLILAVVSLLRATVELESDWRGMKTLGLGRLGIPSLVLESSDEFRVTGFAMTTWDNAWKALDAVGISHSLRQQHTDLHTLVVTSTVLKQQTSELSFKGHEIRCVRRRLLLEALAAELPRVTIRYSSKVVWIEDSDHFKQVHLADGTTIKTKALD